ncbi:lipid droplet-associated protein [Mycolicibacterium baixiangningiae]|uniref:lipid droplet-associated protein n=1 Tax=Mycolicibacterium baixiangningiae TaxID=2761578 RepID=UPI0018D1F5A8|nr:lipid droplet-associated protein [Mycolicibacterium baixiangningiae]
MATAPYGVRLLVGVTVTAVEETRKLPQTILMYPMTVASQVASIVIHLQQNLADLVNRGDETLETLFPPKDEQAEWATFDEDDDSEPASEGERRTEGRFALYSTGEPETTDAGTPSSPKRTSAATDTPEIVTELDYESLTLAQLRARLPSLSVDDLEALLAYEGATRSRAPFQTLLANRITRATAK